ncbi:MAG: Yip1 family protein [Sphingobium sp.]
MAGVFNRAKALVLKPRETWAIIDAESSTVASLYIPYVAMLAAIGPVASLLGGQIFGYGAFGIRYRPGLTSALSSAVVSYVLTLVGVFVLALVINALAPRFGGQKNQTQALKVAAYSGTAAWIAAICGLIPALAVVGLAGLYSLYLLYLGLPRLMKAPDDKALSYTVVVILLTAILFFLVETVSGALTSSAPGRGGVNLPGVFSRDDGSATISVPGGGKIDVKEAEGAVGALGRMAQAAAGKGEDARPVIPAADLRKLLPETLAGLPRISSESGQVMIGSTASAVYESDDRRITLSLSDLGAAGAVALALAPETESEREGAYERAARINGRYTTEKYDRNNRSGSVGVLVADRVMVQAEGRDIDLNQLKAAVAAIDARALERLLR